MIALQGRLRLGWVLVLISLRKLAVTRPNQVWATDITYVPIPGGQILSADSVSDGIGRDFRFGA